MGRCDLHTSLGKDILDVLVELEVRLTRRQGQERVIGQLAESDQRIYFEYDPAFLRNPLWLSPFKLAPEPGLLQHRDLSFGPIFGLFDDSLPDGWGLLLMGRYFSQMGRGLAEISPLDRQIRFPRRPA